VQVDGHAFVSVKLAAAAATSFNLLTAVGHVYRVVVRATAGMTVGIARSTAAFVG